MSGWPYALIILTVLLVACIFIWLKIKKEHDEIKNMTLEDIDINKLSDGTFEGNFEGGIYKWRENSIKVKIESGKLVDIQVGVNKENCKPEFTEPLFNRVLDKQTLEVDTISGASLTSKAYLKGIEAALVKAKNESTK